MTIGMGLSAAELAHMCEALRSPSTVALLHIPFLKGLVSGFSIVGDFQNCIDYVTLFLLVCLNTYPGFSFLYLKWAQKTLSPLVKCWPSPR